MIPNTTRSRRLSSGFRRRLIAVAALAIGATAAANRLHASISILNDSASGQANVFQVSNSDLLQTNLESWNSSNFAWNSPVVLIDGSFGASGSNGGNHASAPNGGEITFSLDLGMSPLGYDITQIDTFASWDTGRDGQEYSVSYSTVSDPSSFISLTGVPAFNPAQAFLDSHTRVRITDTSGVLAEQVARLRFNFTGFENGGTAYREIDAFGLPSTAVPEIGAHATVAVLSLMAFSFFRRLHR